MSYADIVNDQHTPSTIKIFKIKALRRAGTRVAQTILVEAPRRAAQAEGDDMNALAFVQRKAQSGTSPRVAWRRAMKQAQVMSAVAGLIGGGLSGLIGSVFTAAGWLVANEGARQWLSTAGARLLFLTIPLLMIGGYFMDRMEKDNSQPDPKGARHEDDDEEQ